jgi:hypothetical protein
MPEIPGRRDSIGETGDNTATPRWVYVFGIIAIVVAVVFVILHLAGGGFRGH